MPIYEYVCDECETRFERIATAQNGGPTCPKCSSSRATIQFSTFAARTGSGVNSSGDSEGAGACGCAPGSCGCH